MQGRKYARLELGLRSARFNTLSTWNYNLYLVRVTRLGCTKFSARFSAKLELGLCSAIFGCVILYLVV